MMHPQDREGELDDEFQSHLEIETQENIERGMTPEAARYAARRKFGSVALVKELCREAYRFPCLDHWRQDLRFAVRIFRRTPTFTAAAILSIALGIGATTALFSIVNTVLLRPLPYAVSDRLVSLALTNPELNLGFDELPISAPVLRDWREHTGAFDQIAAYQPNALTLTGGPEPERIAAAGASANLFSLLGVEPMLGRTYTTQEDQPGRDSVVLISESLWKRRFGSDPGVIGRRILLDGRSFTILGVMPPHFHFPSTGEMPTVFKQFSRANIWKPLALTPAEMADLGNLSYFAVARLKSGTGIAQARAELTAAVDRLARNSKEFGFSPGWSTSVQTLGDKVSGEVRPTVMLLFGAVGFLLMISCANVANLLLARAARRRGEFAMRLALGAGRFRLLRQLMSEGLLLGIFGGAAGIALAFGLLKLFPSAMPAGILPRMDEIGIDWRVLTFSLGLSLVTALLFGFVPALEASRISIGVALKTAGARAGATGGIRARQALVVAEFAITLVLVIGTMLLARSFLLLMRLPAGFRPENVLTMYVPMAGDGDWRARNLYVREIVQKCAHVSGVQAAGIIDQLPLTRESNISDVTVEGQPIAYTSKAPIADFRGVTPGYFLAMRIPLKRGRLFTDHENGDSPRVAIISETAARRLWPGVADPIGKRFKRGNNANDPWVEVVGVVEDVRSSRLDMQPRPQIYRPYEQNSLLEVTLVIRSTSSPAALASTIRNEIWKLNKDQPIEHVMLMKQVVADSVSGRRLQLLIIGIFSGLALLLAAVGIYGVVSYSVAQRTHEIGLRMALGASRTRILSSTIKEGGLLACIGGAFGLAGALMATKVLRSFLYEVTPTDPAVFAAASALLLAVALAAAYLPARRAARVDPMVALRYE